MSYFIRNFTIVLALALGCATPMMAQAAPKQCSYLISETAAPSCHTVWRDGTQDTVCAKEYGTVSIATNHCTDSDIRDAVREHLERSGRDPGGFNMNHLKKVFLEWGDDSADKEEQRNPVQQE